MERQKACRSVDAGMPTAQVSLREGALVFLKLGTVAFGGPAAHIAVMEDETRYPPSMAYARAVS